MGAWDQYRDVIASQLSAEAWVDVVAGVEAAVRLQQCRDNVVLVAQAKARSDDAARRALASSEEAKATSDAITEAVRVRIAEGLAISGTDPERAAILIAEVDALLRGRLNADVNPAILPFLSEGKAALSEMEAHGADIQAVIDAAAVGIEVSDETADQVVAPCLDYILAASAALAPLVRDPFP